MYQNYLENIKPEEILIYLRKSRADDPLLSTEEVLSKHEAMLDEWAERNLSAPIPESNRYREVVSGENLTDRLIFQKVLKRIESPSIRAVLAVEVQRIGRPSLEEIGRISTIFRYTETMVITPMKTFNIADEYDRELFQRELMRGNEYLEYTKKIMKRGRELSVSQGNYVCSIPPYGYDRIFITEGKRKYPTLAINEEQANVVRMIFDMYVNQNKGVNVIANYLNELHIPPQKGKHWTPYTLRDMLDNDHYVGKVKWNWRKTVIVVEDGEVRKTEPKAKRGDYLIYDGKHPAIISDELFQMALDKKGRNSRQKPTTKMANPLAGLVYCKCGRSMVLRKDSKTTGEYRYNPRLMCSGQTLCNTGSCLHSDIMDSVVDFLKAKISEYEIEAQNTNVDLVKNHARLIKNLEKKLSDIGAREVALWESQVSPNVENRMPSHIFQTITDKLTKEREEVEHSLKEARDSMPDPVDYEKKIVTLQTTLDSLMDDEVEASEKNRLLKTCISKIEYHRDKPERLKGAERKCQWSSPPIELDIKSLL